MWPNLRDAVRALMVGSFAVGLAGSAASCALNVTAVCEAAGGTYTTGVCIRWSPSQQAAQEACEGRGGVYLAGEDTCEFGMGGP